MSNYTAQTDNMGGIQKIYPIMVSSIYNFAKIFNSEIHAFSVYTGTDLTPLYVIQDSIKFSQELKFSDTGDYYDTKLEFVVPKDRIELQEFINTLEFTKYIVVFLDNNGQFKVIGTPTEPMHVSAELDSGNIESKLNGYTIAFTRKLRERSPFSLALPAFYTPQ
jgi:hypothetical protein